jgi:hypothetical protein
MNSPILSRIFLLSLLALPAAAQETLDAPPPSQVLAFTHDTGPVANTTGLAQVVISFPVTVQGAPWLRLAFSAVELAGHPDAGNGSILRLTSITDAEVQELDLRGVRQWTNTSAYFNGDTVLVEVLAQPGTGANRVVMQSVTAGLPPLGGTDTHCGTDTRIASFDGRGARLLPAGCTAWLISDCQSCFLSAGHCVGANMIAQFNVPLSTPGGGLVHPPVEDQFPIDAASVQSQNAGVGFDWSYFGGSTNNLGETPLQHQLARWGTSFPPPFNNQAVIRVTGYGVDSGTANQTQQTVTGLWTGLSGNYLNFSTYVEGGNSGSPAIHEATGTAIGIVTHTSCPTAATQQNYGTRLSQANLLAALANPLGVCSGTPCNAVGVNYCTTGPLMSVISATGTASLAANDLVLHANNVPVGKPGLILYSKNQQLVPFGTNSLCVGGQGFPVKRLPPLNSGAGTTFTFALDQLTLPGGDVILPGETVNFQAWFRTTPGQFETSNGLAILFGA